MSPFAAGLLEWLVAEQGFDAAGVGMDTPLFSSGRLDSLALVDLLDRLERTAGLRARWDEVSLDNLDTLARIEAWVTRAR